MKTALTVTTPSERELVMTREFDAPRGMVFDALTKPELVQRWLLGPPGWTMPVCDIELRVGGTYRYVWRTPMVGKWAWGVRSRRWCAPRASSPQNRMTTTGPAPKRLSPRSTSRSAAR